MKRKPLSLISFGMLLLLSLSACNYPLTSAPTPFVFPTPNLTLTAVFSPPQVVTATPTQPATSVPSATAQMVEPSETASPTSEPSSTATQIPPTSTPVPTNTPVSYVGPGQRSGPSMTAGYLDQPPTIDGSFDEWDLDQNFADSVVAGASNWTGDADLSARATWGWDSTNLYLAARVKDDRYVQNASGKNIFKGDSVEILIDTNVSGDFYLRDLTADDFQLGMSPGSGAPGNDPQAYLWYPSSQAGERQKVKIGAMKTDDGYRIEAQIPWSTFGVTPVAGEHFGFAFSVSDNDNTSQNVQQSMVSNVATRVLTDPTTWGDLTLSSTVPQKRSGPNVEAGYVTSAPTLDGNLNDWSAAKYAVSKVVYGADKWEDAADASGNVMLTWDETYLYIGAQVVDNHYVQNASGENIFLGDSLEILMDSNVAADYYVAGLSADDYQLGISPGNPSPGLNTAAYLWFPKSIAGGRSQVKVSASSSSDGYVVEAAVPWSVFGISPEEGDHYGFAFSISDNDNQDKNVQQSMVSNDAKRVLTDPTTWGDLHLSRP
jgi:hypothetical protein